MKYDSPKTIRRRQQRAENKAIRRRVAKIKTNANEDWNAACDFHLGRIREHIENGFAGSAFRHAEALAHMARGILGRGE